ncbi:glyoxylase-like metal-dependent hydrolase (beta-lactamase superfamily II) [Streptomyces sp. LBL]|uniref:MBL fold metallo-hydrolase n=1 Tax=Streptomyces sp. LBL TaxID=2940562 RepID=UPI0024765DF9|nr:MBL fold metallo-hydrolase [Streptomyces sp. LBL]MDH6630169.1 glyoxylase-like metal-dependent hydrolase (beta-lactamase superfamily II) [Streptomyces sp. LBL]
MPHGQLTYEVFVAPGIPTTVTDLPPDLDRRMWSPISSTLIQGERDAVLVDPLMTIAQADALSEWVAARGKRLTAVYITHAHGDHWFGLARILQEFPQARALALPHVVERMRAQADPDFVKSFWNARFPGQIPENLVPAQPMDEPFIELEGHRLEAVPLGHTDTDDTTCLHVPSLRLVVAGDAVYNNVHLYLAESAREGRKEWLAALDRIEALDPRLVVAGHKDPQAPDTAGAIEQTRAYIHDFARLEQEAESVLDLYEAMLKIHPDRINRGALWGSARFALG